MKTATKVKLKNTISNMIFRFKNHEVTNNSAALSFYFLQASIPLLMVLVSVASKVLQNNAKAIYSLIDFLPSASQEMLIWVIDTMFANTGSASVTIITILFALWSATKGINNLITSINKAYGLEGETKYIKQRLLSLLYTIIFILFIVFILVSQIYGPSILTFINDQVLIRISDKAFGGIFDRVIKTLSSPLFKLTVILIPIFIMSVVFGIFYKFAPNNREDRVPFKDSLLGGIFATVTIYIATFIYSFFLTNFSKQSVVYGTLAGILALFIWLNLVSTILILGAELIDAVRKNYKIKSDEEIDSFDEENKSFKQTLESTIANSKSNDNDKNKKEGHKMDKRSLRKKFRDIRYHMNYDYKNMVDYSIYTKFLNSNLFYEAKSIFIYVSVADEVDTYEIIKKSLEFGKEVYVPYIYDPDNFLMKAVRVYSLDDLGVGEFDIPTSRSLEYIENPDLTIVPGLGFDRDKNRLGYGGGYYDRYLSKNQTKSVGFFASDFEVDHIPADENDQKLDYIITEKEIF
ncbi:5-formyltetrahydrofolate cyclo-ligase [Anaerococcus sp. mt242]|mgnify:FL=1|uniref:5-formyltetrahydrofolate cyclo-ligase n=1 Tax=Anaerococcus sp. mt242 TaxID=2661917 RepID=UPI001931552F|nr:5-formyltetrahydrofolate cyclo-ligase [Anaerococcus sp. mt242]MBM0047046.1 5-formyltetrahydrofolate cyclo-ligase [Anaerococcus sp. mt242]